MQHVEKEKLKKLKELGISNRFFYENVGVTERTLIRFLNQKDYLMNETNIKNLRALIEKIEFLIN